MLSKKTSQKNSSVKTSTLVLTVEDIRHIVRAVGLDVLMDEMIKALFNALEHFDPDKSQMISRDGFHYFMPDFGLLEWMPIHKDSRVTLKTVGYHPNNPEKNHLPTILSTIATYDTATGHLKGLADATFLTALRTGAASAVASKILASPKSTQVGLIGCGAQAVTQLHALSRVFEIKKVWLFDSQQDTAHSFHKRAYFIDPDFQIVDKEQLPELLSSVDILCTCTSEKPGHGPVFSPSNYQDHLHINAVGADFPGKTELPLSLLEKSKVVPDYIPQAVKEGECQQLNTSQISTDLVGLVQNTIDNSDWPSKLTVFDSTGWALEDDIAIELLLNFAKQLSVGTNLELECVSDDPKNPYQLFE